MRALGAVLVLVAAAPAHAGVVVGEGVPFSAGDLERALAARTGGAVAVTLDVRAVAPGRVRVSAARGRWDVDVDVGAARGSIAARLVALNLVGAIEADARLVAAAPAPAATPRWSLAARAGARRGLGGDDLTSTVAGLEVARDGGWWLAGGVDWHEDVRATPAGAGAVDGRGWLARGLIGGRLGPVAVGAGPLVGRVDVDSGAHARWWQSGAAAVARAGWRLAPRWRLELGLGADAYRHRVEVRRDGQVVAATPRVAVAATVGLRWELGR